MNRLTIDLINGRSVKLAEFSGYYYPIITNAPLNYIPQEWNFLGEI
jgi:hypothetical protein